MSRPPNPELIDKIQSVVFELVKQKSVEAITLRMVAKKLGITATTIYYYYQDKEDLINKIKSRGFAELDAHILKSIKPKDNAKNKVKTMVLAFYKWCYENNNIAQLLFEKLPPEMKSDTKASFYKSFNLLGEILKTGADNGEFKIADIEMEASLCYSMIYGIITLHLNKRLTDKFNKNAESLIKKAIDVYLAHITE